MRNQKTKLFKSVISFLILAALVVSAVPMSAAAAVSSGKTVTVSNPYSSMTFVANAQDTLVDKNSSVPATNVSKELKVALSFSYSNSTVLDSYYNGRVFPITVSSCGTLVFDVQANRLEKDISLELYYDAACENYVSGGYLDSLTSSGNHTVDEINIPQAGTYYLRVKSTNWNEASFTNSVYMETAFYTSNNLSLAVNSWYHVASSDNDVYYGISVPGTGYVTLNTSGEISDSVGYIICNSAKQELVAYTNYLKIGNGFKATYRLPKGTYYIKVKSSYFSNDHYSIRWTYSANDYVLSNNAWTTIYPGDYTTTTYMKVVPSQNGYITVNLFDADTYNDAADVTLCNDKKRVISEDEWVYAGSTTSTKQAVFGVKKGKTYYLKVTDASDKTAIKYTMTKVSEKSGAKKKKAVTVKKKKNVTGTIVAGEKKADWYKIKLTKQQVLKFAVTGGSSGYLKFELFYKNGKKYSTYNYFVDSSNTKQTIKTYAKVPKGTYYVKISRRDKNSSGYYKVKWK